MRLAPVALALVVAGCSSRSDPSAPASPTVQQLQITPAIADVDFYSIKQVAYSVTSSSGIAVTNCVWSSPAGTFDQVTTSGSAMLQLGGATHDAPAIADKLGVTVMCAGVIGTATITVNRAFADLLNVKYIRPTDRPIYPPNVNQKVSDINVRSATDNRLFIRCETNNLIPKITWDAATLTGVCAAIRGVPTETPLQLTASDAALCDPARGLLSCNLGHHLFLFDGLLTSVTPGDQGLEVANFIISKVTGRLK